MREGDWFQAVVSQTLAAFTGVTPATGSNSRGGKMVAKFLPAEGEQKINKALFIAEKGPEQFHAGHAIVYQTDRLLGVGTKAWNSVGITLSVRVQILVLFVFESHLGFEQSQASIHHSGTWLWNAQC